MDFGVMGLDGWVDSDTIADTPFVNTSSSSVSEFIKHKQQEQQQPCYGSEFLKQDRSCTTHEQEVDLRSFKVLKTQSSSKPTNNYSLFFDGQQQQMLSFSSPTKSEALNHTLPYRNSGYSNYGSCFNGVNMHGSLGEARWPFTASQYMELEHQALIYKHMIANIPIPTHLLIPIKRALDSAASFSAGFLRPNSLGWGAFQLGFSSNNDPEPGRCRRTDGKKWRCSRDAVANQKYCERHMNRGRHRSRKPVEGRAGHSATTTAKPVPASISASSVVLGASSGRETNSLTIANQQDQNKNLQSVNNVSNVPAATSINGMFYNKVEKAEDTPALSMLSSNLDLKSKEMPFLVPKQQCLSEVTQIGLAASDCHPSLSQKSFSFMSCKNFGSSQEFTDHETVSQSCLRQFMDDWPPSSHSELDMRSDRTRLADFMSSTSSPDHEKGTLSPLRLSREFDPIQMGLGVGSFGNESSQRQANWIPISWETSIGGPLGEVLNSTSNSASVSRNSSALNLMSEGWENSPQIGSSPTGVLQKTAFASVSNSSAGSSPRGEHSKANEGAT